MSVTLHCNRCVAWNPIFITPVIFWGGGCGVVREYAWMRRRTAGIMALTRFDCLHTAYQPAHEQTTSKTVSGLSFEWNRYSRRLTDTRKVMFCPACFVRTGKFEPESTTLILRRLVHRMSRADLEQP